jgi:hypothetical protein
LKSWIHLLIFGAIVILFCLSFGEATMKPQAIPVTVVHHVHHHHSPPFVSNVPTNVQNLTFWNVGWKKVYDTSMILVSTSEKSLQVVMNVMHLFMGYIQRALNQVTELLCRTAAQVKVFSIPSFFHSELYQTMISLPVLDVPWIHSYVNFTSDQLQRAHASVFSNAQKLADATVLFSKKWKQDAIAVYNSWTDISDWKIVIFALQHFGKKMSRRIQDFVMEPRDWQGWVQNTTRKMEDFVAFYLK